MPALRMTDTVTYGPRIAALRSPTSLIFRKLFGRRAVLTGAVILAIVVLAAIFAPWLTPYDPTALKILERPTFAVCRRRPVNGKANPSGTKCRRTLRNW